MFKTFTFLKAVFLLLFLLLCNPGFSQGTLKNAWQAFFDNKRNDAKVLFTEATAKPELAADAYLGLSFIAQQESSATEAFNYFKKFYTQSKNPQPYIYALWTTLSINDSFGKKSAEQLAFLRELTQQKNYDGSIVAMAYSMLGNHYNRSKNVAAADKEFANIGSIDNWAISAEFENISTSGFDKEYKTLTQPQDDAKFINNKGVPVGWHTVPYIRHDKWFDFTYYANAYNAILFAQSFINSAQEQEAQLRIGVSGSVKVWVNDKLVLTEPEERNNDIDAYIQTIKLHKGFNRVLVQIGESYAERSNFLMRLTDNNGHNLPGLVATAQYQPYEKEANYESKKVELLAIAYFKNQIKANPDDVVSSILLAQTYLSMDKTFEARKIVEQLLGKYNSSTFLYSMLYQIFEKSKNRTGAETIRETVKTLDPESDFALDYKYDELIDQQEYEKAGEIIDKIEKLYPARKEYVSVARIKQAQYNKNQADIIKYTDEAYAKYPDNSTAVNYKYLVTLELKKDIPKATEILKKYLATNDNYTLATSLAKTYLETGNANAGIKVFKDEIANDQIALGVYDDLAEHYFDLQQYDKAAECYLTCIKIGATKARYYTALANVYEQQKLNEKAIQYYQQALKFDPTAYESIKSLRKLQGKKDVFTYFDEPNIAAMIKNAPKATSYPEDSFVVLNQEVQKVVYENGGSEDRLYIVAKILNQKGIEAWKEHTIPVNNDQRYLIEVAEVIKANGNKIPAEKNENNLVFTNLEIGDVVNIRYKLENEYTGTLAGHFWDSFYFTKGYPSVNLRYSLLIDRDKKFSYKFSGESIAPIKTQADNFDLYVWKSGNTTSIRYEDKIPALADITNVFYLTSLPDWKFVANWYNDIASAKARSNYEVKSVIEDLFADGKKLTEMQKVERIYNYITGNINYSSVPFRQSGIVPQNPADVINTRIGDCKDVSTLFVTMCKEVGIKAQLVLVKTREFGLNSMPLPTIDFNHCIAKVNLDNREYYIELTSKYLPFKANFTERVNSTILDIGSEDTPAIKYLDPVTRSRNDIFRTTTIELKNKDLVIDESAYQTAAISALMRYVYKDLSENDQIKKTKEALSKSYPDNEITHMSFQNLDNALSDTVGSKISYQLKNVVKDIAGMQIFSLPWSDKFTPASFQIVSPRVSGLDISQFFPMDNEIETIVITLPANKKLIEMPEAVNINTDIMDFSLVPKMQNGKLVLTRTLKIKKGYLPAEKVNAFNEAFKKMVEIDNKEFAIR